MKYIKNFRILEIPLGETIDGKHYLYLKEHTGQSMKGKSDNGKVLFVGNIDYRINLSEEDINGYLRLLFSRFGEIQNISISSIKNKNVHKNEINTRFAHIEFLKKSYVKFSLNASDNDYILACQEICNNYGIKLETKKLSTIKAMFPFIDEDDDDLQRTIDEYMSQFDQNEILSLKKRDEALLQVDEDGFIPVKPRNKRKVVIADSEHNNNKNNNSQKKSKKNTELKNFYHFQLKQEKIKDLENLRKKFAEDKEKVAKLKEQRKFKPF